MKSDKTIALLTDHRYVGSARPGDWYHENILHEDRLLQQELEHRGFQSVRLDWADSSVRFQDFRAVVLRTTWDYYERIDEFLAWLDGLPAEVTLLNPPDAVRWNLHKRYMTDLERKGISIVPTRLLPAGSSPDLPALLESTGWDEAVIKPAISGGARLTYRFSRGNAGQIATILQPHMEREDFMLQPFMPHILDEGEDTLMVLNGRFTHAIRKKPKPGDYRVQDDHGGTVQAHTPTPRQTELALRAMQATGFDLAYGRVDLVSGPDGEPMVMELEIIEPELWLRYHPPAAADFAEGILRKL